ncbi:MAG: hypothetical protein ABSA02_03560 [Trebonia sp.]|jgi:hypothetical protein
MLIAVGGGLAALAVTLFPWTAIAAPPAVKLSPAPLGMNIPPWAALYASASSGSNLQTLLKNAHVSQVRYGGGEYADEYDWQTNTDIANCPSTAMSEYEAKCATFNALGLTSLSGKARAIGAQSLVTVNYGSGTPAEAEAEVKQARAPGQQVALWELGNEGYGCWEANDYLADAPERYQGFRPTAAATCPMAVKGVAAGMEIMAKSYGANAAKFMAAMRAANPDAVLGVPWAFDPTVGGGSVAGNTEWNNTVLAEDKRYIGFVDAHWYPLSYGGTTGAARNPSAGQVIHTVYQIPAEYAKIKAALQAVGLPGAKIVIGETNVSYRATDTACTAVGALFAASDALEWLSLGAFSVDWWTLNGYGNTGTTCSHPDEGMFSSDSEPVPESPYLGYLLAGALAQPGAKLTALAISPFAVSSAVLAFQSVLPDGRSAVLLVNTSTSATEHVAFTSSLSGELTAVRYRAGNQNGFATKTTTWTCPAAGVAKGIILPAESMTLLKEN